MLQSTISFFPTTPAVLRHLLLANWLTEHFPNLSDFVALMLGLAIIGAMIYWTKGAKSSRNGFTIDVSDDDITFTGRFPSHMQNTVADFLRNDVRLAGSYEIRGRWETDGSRPMLIVVVRGDNARPMEQRIRNFLKLNLKPPRGK